jgi:hypothetical protein
MMTFSITQKLLFFPYSYGKISAHCSVTKSDHALNGFHILIHQMEYNKILLMKDHIYE